ncbi:MAG: hypothetical protein DIU70_003105 [Bacillota bacterium]
MPMDRLYEDIIVNLETKQLDPATFERIAVRIANSRGLNVLPVPGGQDAGYDGAILDTEEGRLPGPLVATTQKKALSNLRRNLSRHAAMYPDAAKRAFFVTSRRLTPGQRRNLEKEAKKLGYVLIGIADQEAVAEHLYYDPQSCYELLGFKGVPPALSPLPPRRRPHWDVDLVGRDVAFDRLRNLDGDLLLIGMPGSGKTSLLSQAAKENLGLFARTIDRDSLAADLRRYQPRAVFVDGLDDQVAAVRTLVSLREESGIQFHIVVTGWYEDDEIVQLLGLGPNQRVHLEPLELDELVEVVRRLGLAGPPALIHNIVHQAGGSPGLAATLTMACFSGNVREVVTGEILLRHVRITLKHLPIDAKKAEMALAVISVGGETGMHLRDVAEEIGMHPLELQRLLRDIEAGGIIRPTDWGTVSVRPAQLRAVLVASTFFGPYPIPVVGLLDKAPSRVSALRTLIAAARNRPEPPELRSLLTVANSDVWREYAWLGPEQCRWVLSQHPEHLIAVSEAALHFIPEEVLPLLLAAAKGGEHSTRDHPLRVISDWCKSARPGSGQAVSRRQMTIQAALRYLENTGDIHTAVRAIAQVLTPEYRALDPHPGQGTTVTWGILTPEEIEQLIVIWRNCVSRLRGHKDLPWRVLLDAAREVTPAPPVHGQSLVAESLAAARKLRDIMAFDIFQLAEGHPGVAYEARQLASQHEGWPAETEQERLYALLFGKGSVSDYQEHEARTIVQLASIAGEWVNCRPSEVMDILASVTTAARGVSHTGRDRRRFLAEELSKRVEPLPWLQAAIQSGLDYDVVIPFLRRAIATNAPGWERVALTCIGTPAEAAAVEGALVAGGPPELLMAISPLLPKYKSVVYTVCSHQNVSPTAVHTLLTHEDDSVASEAAIWLWHAKNGNIDEALKPIWRDALLRANYQATWCGDILATDASLAFAWLKRRIETGDRITLLREDLLEMAAKPLNEDQRFELLVMTDDTIADYEFVLTLVGGSVELFKRLLRAGRQDLCLMALARPKDEIWAQFVVAAHDHGLSIEDIARASNLVSSFWGPESEHLREQIEKVAPFLEDPREPVRRVARRITERLQLEREMALTREREERVWGL